MNEPGLSLFWEVWRAEIGKPGPHSMVNLGSLADLGTRCALLIQSRAEWVGVLYDFGTREAPQKHDGTRDAISWKINSVQLDITFLLNKSKSMWSVGSDLLQTFSRIVLQQKVGTPVEMDCTGI